MRSQAAAHHACALLKTSTTSRRIRVSIAAVDLSSGGGKYRRFAGKGLEWREWTINPHSAATAATIDEFRMNVSRTVESPTT
jgi:hypothetical protein